MSTLPTGVLFSYEHSNMVQVNMFFTIFEDSDYLRLAVQQDCTIQQREKLTFEIGKGLSHQHLQRNSQLHAREGQMVKVRRRYVDAHTTPKHSSCHFC